VEQTGYTFEQVLQENRDVVFNLLFRLTGDFHISEDLFQETFLKVYRGFRDFRGHAKLSTWIYTIALNVFRDHVRKKRRVGGPEKGYDEFGDLERAADTETPEEQYLAAEERASLQRQLNGLKPALRIPVVLYYVEGFSIRNISDLTGRSLSDIKVSLHRARKILQKRMGIQQ
jgi:RNA polymerase sigma-70 factor (ECF subfamily)